MAEPHPVAAHHFDDLAQQHEAARLGMWIFLTTEVLFFGGLFLGYAVYRSANPRAFSEGSRHLDLVLGATNTVVLITSSLTMALAVRAAATGRRRALLGLLAVTMLLAAAFLGIKSAEYTHKFEERLFPGRGFAGSRQTAMFFSFYFVMTGMHGLHVVIGIGVLAVLWLLAARGRFSPEHHAPVEIAGLYWHFVDVVWIFLFPLFYLIGLHA